MLASDGRFCVLFASRLIAAIDLTNQHSVSDLSEHSVRHVAGLNTKAPIFSRDRSCAPGRRLPAYRQPAALPGASWRTQPRGVALGAPQVRSETISSSSMPPFAKGRISAFSAASNSAASASPIAARLQVARECWQMTKSATL